MDKYVIIIGSMKSGTTTLFDLLAAHPRIAPSRIKEPGYFALEEVHQRGEDWFQSLFDFDPDRHVYRLEGSTDYTKDPFLTGVWDRMTGRPARYKLIYIMRHPLRRIESHARHVQGTGKELGQRLSDRPDHGLDAGISPVSLAVSDYARQLDAFVEARANGDLLLLTLEELKSDPATAMRQLWRYLELDPPEAPDVLPASNIAGSKVRTSKSWMLLSRLRPLMALGRAVLPVGMRQRIRQSFTRQVKEQGRFTLTREEEAELLDRLAPGLRRLRDDYGIDVTRLWGIDPGP